MDMNLFRGILTVILLVLFVGLCIWIFSRKRKKQYDDAAKMALDSHHSDKKQEVKRDE
ncbi:cbb3-type cytochrome oxidase subunit 3 [Kangiella spongicola]|uniref:CcoQ/FixQ family Cbb3-type cytochrome c oxidase assembly chaperone n=1 Tax=Kangiella spongicola TaxID=796379 RepID=A0A318D2F4_9GAMM|nr:cbb3-type cytochrome c oxidase subunit 3 [Kangiella spongicola]PXF63422.1 CcoQ/FixQ family Cbb3-type cytochrome c oxidase assembly chaperone [Kangiella spongicola]